MSLNYCENTTTFDKLSARWGWSVVLSEPLPIETDARTISDVAERWGNEQLIPDSCSLSISDLSSSIDALQNRWDVGVPYERMMSIDGVKYLYSCEFIDRLDSFLMSECHSGSSRGEIDFMNRFFSYESGIVNGSEFDALDDLVCAMINDGMTCSEFQGVTCG